MRGNRGEVGGSGGGAAADGAGGGVGARVVVEEEVLEVVAVPCFTRKLVCINGLGELQSHLHQRSLGHKGGTIAAAASSFLSLSVRKRVGGVACSGDPFMPLLMLKYCKVLRRSVCEESTFLESVW